MTENLLGHFFDADSLRLSSQIQSQWDCEHATIRCTCQENTNETNRRYGKKYCINILICLGEGGRIYRFFI